MTDRSRTERRGLFDEATRLRLLEDDADEHERAVRLLDRRISKLLTIAVSTLVSTCTTIVVVLAQIALTR